LIKAVFSASLLQSSVSHDHSNMRIYCSNNFFYHQSWKFFFFWSRFFNEWKVQKNSIYL